MVPVNPGQLHSVRGLLLMYCKKKILIFTTHHGQIASGAIKNKTCTDTLQCQQKIHADPESSLFSYLTQRY